MNMSNELWSVIHKLLTIMIMKLSEHFRNLYCKKNVNILCYKSNVTNDNINNTSLQIM